MIDLYYWPTPNGHKIPIMLEECGLDYKVHPINMLKGDQFTPAYLKINPNNKIPAIVDRKGPGGKPYKVFESGAILMYLAEKTGKFMPKDIRGRSEVMQWLFWQVGGLGPMAGQKGHFLHSAPEPIPYAIDRYTKETDRLLGVLDRRLEGRAFICGDYSIADMASYGWVFSQQKRDPKVLANFANVRRWVDAIKARPATIAAYAKGEPLLAAPVSEEERKRNLYGQTAANIAARIS